MTSAMADVGRPGNNPLTRARQAIADIVESIYLDHPHISKITTHAYIPDVSDNFPVAFTQLEPAEYTTTRKNHRKRDLNLIVLVGKEWQERDAQEFLDYLLEGADTITAALTLARAEDKTLGGTVRDFDVLGDEPLRVQQLAGYQAWGHQWRITFSMGDNYG